MSILPKIGDDYKERINNLFKYIVFYKRDSKSIIKTLKPKVHGSNLEALSVPLECFKVENIDEAHDKLTLTFADYVIEGVITWKGNNEGHWIFMGYE